MKCKKTPLRYPALVLCLVFLFTICLPALGEQSEPDEVKNVPTLTDVVYENEQGTITYPVFFGSNDPQVDMAVNVAIYSQGKIDQRINTLNALKKDGWGLEVSYQAFLKENLLSLVISALGDMGSGWNGQEYASITFDLLQGKAVTAQQLFLDADEAFTYMETILEEDLYPSLSGYMTHDALTPMPKNRFFIDDKGITFYYEPQKFSYLSGYSGSIHFLFSELEPYLNLKTGSVLSVIGIGETLSLSEKSLPLIEEAVKKGSLPQVPVAIGDPLPQIIEAHRLLSDPDNFPGGRFIHIEDPLFRDVWLMTDSLYQGYDQSIVQGIRTTRGNLSGLITGNTTQQEWQKVLGEPQSSIVIDEQTAYEYWLVPGTSDYYSYGDYQLRLHCDEQGLLACIMVIQ